MYWIELRFAAGEMSSAPRDDAIAPLPVSEPGNGSVNARRWRRITYSREFLLAVGSSEACKAPPAGVDMSKHQDDATLWSLEAASRACSFRAEPWRARSAGRSGGSQGDLLQHARGDRRFVSNSSLLVLLRVNSVYMIDWSAC
jgi:hypothetical protein